MNRTPTWAALLGAAVQLAALALCSWAMESAQGRRRGLPRAAEPLPPQAS